MTYSWAADCQRSFHDGIAAMRAAYLRERRPGETAEQWVQRTCRDNHYFRRGESNGKPQMDVSEMQGQPQNRAGTDRRERQAG